MLLRLVRLVNPSDRGLNEPQVGGGKRKTQPDARKSLQSAMCVSSAELDWTDRQNAMVSAHDFGAHFSPLGDGCQQCVRWGRHSCLPNAGAVIGRRLLGWQMYCHPWNRRKFGGGSTTATPTYCSRPTGLSRSCHIHRRSRCFPLILLPPSGGVLAGPQTGRFAGR